MKRFEFLEHTADTKIRAYGATLEEAFGNVVIATTTVMTNPDLIQEKNTKEIKIKSNTLKALLYDFMEELIFLLDTEGFITKTTKNLKIKKQNNNYELSVQLIGDHAKNYEIHSTIKATTYSEMEITQNEEGFTIQIVHDL